MRFRACAPALPKRDENNELRDALGPSADPRVPSGREGALPRGGVIDATAGASARLLARAAPSGSAKRVEGTKVTNLRRRALSRVDRWQKNSRRHHFPGFGADARTARTVSMETGIQQVGIAGAIAIQTFKGQALDKAIATIAVFGIFTVAFGLLWSGILRFACAAPPEEEKAQEKPPFDEESPVVITA